MTVDTPAISVENLSKRYRLGPSHAGRTFREALQQVATGAFRRRQPSSSDFWALRDVSFEVRRGEVVGIIGRNGAGKSTLLKILSRIAEPTSGRAAVFGRVGSLLEVGTGFHPELTGRENVYLNGAILGMKRREIDSRFDEIVAFAEVERFIDTPVKHYSSGMYVRLAFAVAAHLEPEILIVDEVLAVGDALFQRKCLDHIGRIKDEGGTVLLISHSMAVVGRTCDNAYLLEAGRLVAHGSPPTVIDAYARLQGEDKRALAAHAEMQSADPLRWGDGAARITSVATAANGSYTRVFGAEPTVDVVLEFEVARPIDDGVLGIAIQNASGVLVFATNTIEMGLPLQRFETDRGYRARFSIDNVFGDGMYSISCAVNNHDRTRPYCRLEDVHSFEVTGRSGRSLLWPRHTLHVESTVEH